MDGINQWLLSSALGPLMLSRRMLRPVAGKQRRPALLYCPADESVGIMPAQSADCRHGMNNVPHRAKAHDQDPHRASNCEYVLKRVMCLLIFSCQHVRSRCSIE